MLVFIRSSYEEWMFYLVKVEIRVVCPFLVDAPFLVFEVHWQKLGSTWQNWSCLWSWSSEKLLMMLVPRVTPTITTMRERAILIRGFRLERLVGNSLVKQICTQGVHCSYDQWLLSLRRWRQGLCVRRHLKECAGRCFSYSNYKPPDPWMGSEGDTLSTVLGLGLLLIKEVEFDVGIVAKKGVRFLSH